MTRGIDLVRDLQLGNFSGGMLKKDEIALRRRLANLTMISDIYNRTTGVTDVGYDDFGGDNADSIFKIDLTNTTSKAALPIGTTDLTPLVTNPSAGFLTGQEVTIYDDVNLERVMVTRAETSTGPGTATATNSTVVASAYSTSGNGGRKLIKLDSGSLIAAMYNSGSIYIYRSVDNGLNWSQIYTTGSAFGPYICIEKLPNNRITVFFGTNADIYCIIINEDGTGYSYRQFESNQTAIAGISVTTAPDGTLHAMWSSKNSTYPNSYNIRYSKSTDAGVTWTVPTQLTTYNNTVDNCNTPTIIVDNLGYPHIYFVWAGSAIYELIELTTKYTTQLYSYPSTGFGNKRVFSGGNYSQANISATVAPNGRLWVAWNGLDSTDTASHNLRVAYSDDGGINWPTVSKLTSGNAYSQVSPSITTDKNSIIHIVFHGIDPAINGSNFQIRRMSYNGTWSAITTMTNHTSAGVQSTNPSTVVDKTLDFTVPLFINQNSQDSKIAFYGTWQGNIQTTYLQVQALTKSYKTGAKIARTTAVLDTVNKCLKFDGYTGTVTNTITTPTTVVPSAYDTGGSGGRKIVRLSNGWLVATAYDSTTSTHYFYISTDKGNTWNQLCYVASSTGFKTGSSIASSGTTIYFISPYLTSSIVGYHFDVTTQNNVNLAGTTSEKFIDGSQTAINTTSIAIAPDGSIHAAWATKNSTNPNSFNIRYSKSTDNAVTWSAITTITTNNTAGLDNQSPCIIVKSDNNPILFWYTYQSSTLFTITGSVYNGTAWGFVNGSGAQKQLTSSPSYPQYSPSIAIAPNGRIWVTWYGYDATDTGYTNIRISYSDDGGTTWSAMQKLTNGNTYHQSAPSITIDKNNNVYVVFYGIDPAINTSQNQIRKIVWNGSAWSAITTLTNNTTGAATISATLMDNTLDLTDPLIIYRDQQTSSVKFRGTWVTAAKVSVLVDDIRYTKVDTSHVDDTTFWIEYEKDPGLTVSAVYSSMDSSVTTTESYQSMLRNEQINPSITQTVVDASKVEDTFNIGSPTRNDKGELRITISRTTTTIDKKITKVLGAVS
jgi:hypothetical protein